MGVVSDGLGPPPAGLASAPVTSVVWQPGPEAEQAVSTLTLPAARPRPSFGSTKRKVVSTTQSMQPRRFGIFGGIGAVVFVAGTGFQWVLILAGVGSTASYIWQAVASIELSFALNRLFTWRDRHIDMAGSLVKWNAQKLALSVPNIAVYYLLIGRGMNWLVANLLLTAVFTAVNYAGAHLWSFRGIHLPRHRAAVRSPTAAESAQAGQAIIDLAPALPAGDLPEVSVVIPVKRSQRTIRQTVDSLLTQDYPGLIEVIVVGDVGDQTWQALEDVTDPRLLIVEHEEIPGRLEPAIKRDVGLRKARGELLALADSDIVMDPDWLSRAVGLLIAQRAGVVCGGMRSAEDSFWGRFVDGNSLAAKTPRVPRSYRVTARNFGKHGRKPPITANAVMKRQVYDDCPMDDSWPYGYEDYEWFWRIAKTGHQIYYAAGLTGAHHHRQSFRALAWEYRVSARGCAHFIRSHPDSPLARKRRSQARMLPLAALGLLAGAWLAALAGYGWQLMALAVVAACALAIREAFSARSLEAIVYPAAGMALGTLFTLDLGRHLAVRGGTGANMARSQVVDRPRPAVRAPSAGELRAAPADPEPPARVPVWVRVMLGAAFLVVLAAGGAVRFWQLRTKPEWQFDEAIYWNIAHNLQVHGTLNEHITFGTQWVPFLYQPPLYVLALARWFSITSPTIYEARVLGVICSLASLFLIWRLISRLHGPKAALVVSLPIVFDGWLLFIQRVSYIENATLLLVVAAMLLYQRALDKARWHRFLLAGMMLGFAVCVKYTALYLIPAVLLCWIITRRSVRGHLLMLGAAAAIILSEQVALTILFDPAGHKWFVDQSLTQIGRVLGVGASRGTLSSPGQLIHLMLAQYKVFLPSFAIALAAVVLIIVKLTRCYRRRTVAPLRAQALLYSWAIAGTFVFGASSLRYPQYFAMVLVPLYCLWWTEVWRWARGKGRVLVAIGAVIAVVAGLTSFWLRVGSESVTENVFAEVQQYAAAHIPAHAVVLADESVGDLISQPYCQEQAATPCLWHASYAITWNTYLQSTFKLGDPAFHFMMQNAVKVWSRQGFNGTITVWKLQS
jgi:4-amino-4-deoxy-L-arabinose transferase-like glycosyltransferase/putative flippase GtrA/GT2 family glycosyltransferase